MRSLRERVLSRVVVIDGCWPWPGAKTTDGYGHVREAGRSSRVLYVHRLFYEWFVGPIPPGFTIDHLCRNRACCRPDHLEAVTRRENSLRGSDPRMAAHRERRCTQGHPASELYYRRGTRRVARCRACRRARSAAKRKAVAADG